MTMTIRWEPTGTGDESVTYFVDGRPVGAGDRGFDRVLDLAERHDGPVTLEVTSVSLGGRSLHEDLPFHARLGELRTRLGERQLRYGDT
jgi:hypothetical protein